MDEKLWLPKMIRVNVVPEGSIDAALNMMRKVVPEHVMSDHNIQWDSGEITSPTRIHLVEFV